MTHYSDSTLKLINRRVENHNYFRVQEEDLAVAVGGGVSNAKGD